jgi:peptidylprolyl isomerase
MSEHPRLGRAGPASTTLLTLLALLAVPAAPAATPALDAELDRILALLPGRYAGDAPDPRDPAGLQRRPLQHKIARIEAPQFGGDTVFYHQISRDGLDSPTPFQQKIYVFDRSPGRSVNRMRSFVFRPGQGFANLERDPAAQKSLDPAALMNFPEACAIRWSRGDTEGSFVARVRREDCSYESAAFRQSISPELTYVLSAGSFGIEDLLYGVDGKPLFPPTGLLTAARLPAAAPARTLAEVLAASQPADWRPLDAERTLYLELDAGRVVFELAPAFAPRHVENLRALVAARWFDGLAITRVQDNFVAQWGDPDGTRAIVGAASRVAPEFARAWSADLPFTVLPDPDGYAPQVGFVEGFAAAGDRKAGQAWLAHCYGSLGVGRDNSADSGSGAELYVVIGHAPRQLDRNITLVGRALRGMELLASLPRGTGPMGFYEKPEQRVPIRRVRLAAELPVAERSPLEVLRTDTDTFAALVEARRNRRDDWYLVPAGHIDLCSVPLPVRETVNGTSP